MLFTIVERWRGPQKSHMFVLFSFPKRSQKTNGNENTQNCSKKTLGSEIYAFGTEKCDLGVRPKTGTWSRKRLRNPLLLDLGAARHHCSPRVPPRPPKVTKMTPEIVKQSKKLTQTKTKQIKLLTYRFPLKKLRKKPYKKGQRSLSVSRAPGKRGTEKLGNQGTREQRS